MEGHSQRGGGIPLILQHKGIDIKGESINGLNWGGELVQIGNVEVKLNLIACLGKWFEVKGDEEDEVFLIPRDAAYPGKEVLQIVETIVNLAPDECDIQEDGSLRLWWD